MIPIKAGREIETMREGGRRLSQVLSQVLSVAKPGVSLKKLDQLTESLIKKKGGRPSFKMVEGYDWATCININQGVVHGIPGNYRLRKDDLASIDIGFFYKGFHTDMAKTVRIKDLPAGKAGRKNRRVEDEFLKAGKVALEQAIKAARPDKRGGAYFGGN